MIALRPYLRQAKAHAIRFRKTGRPIILMMQRRGGSTMLADAIAEAQGVWFVNEPFAVLPGHPGYALKRRLLPEREHSQYFALDSAEEAQFSLYVDALLGARLPSLGTARRAGPGLTAHRVCLKVLNAPWMLDWFRRNTDAHVLPVLRHPGGQALSALRTGWDMPVRAYAKRPDVLAQYFDPAQVARIEALAAGPITWELAVLDWIVATAPVRRAQARGLTVWQYEEIAASPDKFARRVLAHGLDLGPERRISARLTRPSNSARFSTTDTRRLLARGETASVAQQWRGKLEGDMARQGQALLEEFAVAGYAF